MEADKVQRMPAGFPFQLCVPASSPSTLFPPMPIFGVQQMYATLLQHQLLQLQQHSQPQQSPNCLGQELSPGLSDRASSGADSPSTKKLQLDDNGCPICPACGDKIQENEFASHVEKEKSNLKNTIESAKESKADEEEILCAELDPIRRKRESEFNRIRGNHLKRIALKRGIGAIRDSLTPFSHQSNDESGSTGSPEIKKEDDSPSTLNTSIPCSVRLFIFNLAILIRRQLIFETDWRYVRVHLIQS
ncbi:unnamed protein product [Auanema sp. JU1783]|nr:unnamed protein product [Auanema sp. JU1783]